MLSSLHCLYGNVAIRETPPALDRNIFESL